MSRLFLILGGVFVAIIELVVFQFGFIDFYITMVHVVPKYRQSDSGGAAWDIHEKTIR